MINTLTYRWLLEALDEETATFRYGADPGTLRLSRGDWEQIGRPGIVEFTPQPATPYEATR